MRYVKCNSKIEKKKILKKKKRETVPGFWTFENNCSSHFGSTYTKTTALWGWGVITSKIHALEKTQTQKKTEEVVSFNISVILGTVTTL